DLLGGFAPKRPDEIRSSEAAQPGPELTEKLPPVIGLRQLRHSSPFYSCHAKESSTRFGRFDIDVHVHLPRRANSNGAAVNHAAAEADSFDAGPFSVTRDFESNGIRITALARRGAYSSAATRPTAAPTRHAGAYSPDWRSSRTQRSSDWSAGHRTSPGLSD